MNRCLELAKMGLPSAMPNPSVGAVLVYENRIIGEGFTSSYGGNHGEVNCINSVVNKDLIPQSTLYVSLEPCAHTGKTPPCADLIVKNKIPKVVIGCVDTFSEVAGKGIERLRQNGIELELGVLENECRELNKRFFTFHENNRPYIILKWAQTSDNFIAPKKEKHDQERWITGSLTNQFTHKMRGMEMAILVGKNTVLIDNPSLTTRNYTGKNPLRIVLDRHLETWKKKELHSVFNSEAETIIFNSISNFHEKNCEGIVVDYTKNVMTQLMNILVEKNIQSLIVEGGTQTLQSFIDSELWDEAVVISSQKEFGEGVLAPKISGRLSQQFEIEKDIVRIYKNPIL